MSLNQSLISDFSEYYRRSQRTKIKYKLHYTDYLRVNGRHSSSAKQFLDSKPITSAK